MSTQRSLIFARRIIPFILLVPLLLVCTFLVLLGWGKSEAEEFWDAVS